MNQALVLDIMKRAFMTLIMVAGPALVVALVVGLLVSILQATTQIQEQTLSFVPKVLSIIFTLIIFGSFMINKLTSLFTELYKLIPVIN